MCEQWFSTIKLPLTFEQFLELPRNSAYKYEYFDDTAWLSPRPKLHHARLELGRAMGPAAIESREPIVLRPLEEGDWEGLPPLFAGAFHRVQPFASLDDENRLEAARQCLDRTRTGGDGPVIGPACFVAVEPDVPRPLGALLVTLMPDVDLTGFSSTRWREAPPPDWLEQRIGRPHLTWVFVSPWYANHGVGSALLLASAAALRGLGYRELASTFLLGNDASTLWHWRNGFELLAYPGSMRLIHRRVRESSPAPPADP